VRRGQGWRHEDGGYLMAGTPSALRAMIAEYGWQEHGKQISAPPTAATTLLSGRAA
jgi:hypothetical protein